jgi:hypothetical protein
LNPWARSGKPSAPQPVGEADLLERAVESLGEEREALGTVGRGLRVLADARNLPHQANRILAGREVGLVVLEEADLGRGAPSFGQVVVEEIGVAPDHPQHATGAFAVTVEIVDAEDPCRPQVVGQRFGLRATADDGQLHLPSTTLVPAVAVLHDLALVFGGPFEELEVDHSVLDLIGEFDELISIRGLDDDVDGLHIEDLKPLDGSFVDGALVQLEDFLVAEPPHLLGLADVDPRHPPVDHDVVAQDVDGDAGVFRHLVRDSPLETAGLRRLPFVRRHVDGKRHLGLHHQPLRPAPAVTELLDQGELLEGSVELARQEIADHLRLDRDLLTDPAELDHQHQAIAVDRL